MSAIINVNDIYFSYDDKEILKGVSLDVEEGDFIAIVGHNGSGKSTLAKLLNGLYAPDKGSVSVLGMDTGDDDKKFDIRKNVGMVFQNPDNQIVATIVEEDVAFGPENLGIDPKKIRELVDDALKTVGMYEYREHATYKLSGGQKQRIAIAGVIAMNPKCIIFDESTAMLDPKGRKEVLDTIKKLNKNGITVIMITHFMEEAAIAKKIVVMNDGKIELVGTPKEVFDKVDYLKSISLTVPGSSMLAYELKKEGFDLGKGIITEEEFVERFENYFKEKKKCR
jgi:energy-coupling factor transport system ATP-binding protein